MQWHAAAVNTDVVREIRPKVEKPKVEETRAKEPKTTLIGESDEIQRIKDMIKEISKYDVNVLIQGETGTGKELVARMIHENSPRRQHPFIAVNCAALSESIIESELFGHEKGAFTDAVGQRKGKFEYANKGTLFLDEIGSVSYRAQSKLLRTLQENTITRVGSNDAIKTNTRIISATNENLRTNVAEKTFRADLFYRLNVIPIYLPPLRTRASDIPMLVKFFVDKHSKLLGIEYRDINMESIKTLQRSYHWPGNVRELENIVIRILAYDNLENNITSEKMLDEDTAFHLRDGLTHRQYMDSFEAKILVVHLEKHSWNITNTAKSLNVHRNTLMNKMERHGIRYFKND